MSAHTHRLGPGRHHPAHERETIYRDLRTAGYEPTDHGRASYG